MNLKIFISVFVCIIVKSCSKDKKHVEIVIHYSKKKNTNDIMGEDSESNKVIKIINWLIGGLVGFLIYGP